MLIDFQAGAGTLTSYKLAEILSVSEEKIPFPPLIGGTRFMFQVFKTHNRFLSQLSLISKN